MFNLYWRKLALVYKGKEIWWVKNKVIEENPEPEEIVLETFDKAASKLPKFPRINLDRKNKKPNKRRLIVAQSGMRTEVHEKGYERNPITVEHTYSEIKNVTLKDLLDYDLDEVIAYLKDRNMKLTTVDCKEETSNEKAL